MKRQEKKKEEKKKRRKERREKREAKSKEGDKVSLVDEHNNCISLPHFFLLLTRTLSCGAEAKEAQRKENEKVQKK